MADQADNISAGLFAIAKAIDGLAYQIKSLGNGDAATEMGAIEALGQTISEAMSDLGDDNVQAAKIMASAIKDRERADVLGNDIYKAMEQVSLAIGSQ